MSLRPRKALRAGGLFRLAAVAFLAFYAWAGSGHGLVLCIQALAHHEAPAGPACSLEGDAAPCMCPLEKSQAGDCCCKHGHEDKGSAADEAPGCAQLRECGSHADQAQLQLPRLAPHAPSRPWEFRVAAAPAAAMPPCGHFQSPCLEPSEKVPI